MNIPQWKSIQNTKLFIHENAFENVVCEMVAILSRGRRVNNGGACGSSLFDNMTANPRSEDKGVRSSKFHQLSNVLLFIFFTQPQWSLAKMLQMFLLASMFEAVPSNISMWSVPFVSGWYKYRLTLHQSDQWIMDSIYRWKFSLYFRGYWQSPCTPLRQANACR